MFSLYYLKKPTVYLTLVKFYTIIEYGLFSLMFYYFFNSKTIKKVILISIIPFTIFSVINLFYNQYNFSNYPLLYEFISFMIFIIFYFYEKMKIEYTVPVYNLISFWISVGLFFYFTGNFFFLLFSSTNIGKTFINQMQIIYTVVTITKNLLLCFSLHGSETKSEQNNQYIFPEDLHLDDFTPNQNTTN